MQIDEKYRVPIEIARMVKRAEDALSTDKENARRYVKLVHGVLPRKRAKRSNLFIRKIHAFIENAVARDVSAQFQYKPYFDLESRSGRNTTQADNAEKVLQYYLERAELEMKSITWFKQSITENVGIVKLGWRKVERKQRRRMPLNEAMELVPDFKLPKELEDLFAVTQDGISWEVIEGPLDEEQVAQRMLEGWQIVTLDQASPEVQQQFSVVVDVPKVTYDGLEFTPIDFQDAFWDADAANVSELRYAGHHFGATLKDLKEQKKSGVPYKNLAVLEEWAKSARPIPELARYKRRSDLGKSTSSDFSEYDTVFKCTEVWHAQDQKLYTYVTTGGDTYTDAEFGILVRDESWPYWHGELPYHFLPATVVPFEITGVGIPELLEHLQNERNEIRNIAMDMKVMAIMPPMVINTNVVPDGKEKLQNLEPNKIIELELEENIPVQNVYQQLRPDSSAIQNAEFLIRTIDQEMEEVSGIAKVLTGTPIQRRTTYSEQSLLANEANLRLQLRLRVNDAIMKRMAAQAVQLLDQFCDPEIEVRITGDDKTPAFVTVNREDLSFDFDIYPASSSAESFANQLSEANQMINAYNSIKGSALEVVVKPIEFATEYFRKIGVKNAQKFLKTAEEIQAEQEAEMAQQQAQRQGQAPVQQPFDENALISQEQDMLAQGQVPPVSPDQNHMEHYKWHSEFMSQRMGELAQQGILEEAAMQDPVVAAILQHVQMHGEQSPELMQMLQTAQGGMMQ